MTIPLFCPDTRLRNSYANATVQILGYLITKEIDSFGRTLVNRAVRCVIKQPTEALITDVCDGKRLRFEPLNLFCAQAAIALENARLNQQAQTEKTSWGKLVVHENNNSVGLQAVNLQPALKEVFHVHS